MEACSDRVRGQPDDHANVHTLMEDDGDKTGFAQLLPFPRKRVGRLQCDKTVEHIWPTGMFKAALRSGPALCE